MFLLFIYFFLSLNLYVFPISYCTDSRLYQFSFLFRQGSLDLNCIYCKRNLEYPWCVSTACVYVCVRLYMHIHI